MSQNTQNTQNKYVSREEFNSLLQVVTKNIEYISSLKSTLDKLSSYTVSLEKRLQLVEMNSDDIHYTPTEESNSVEERDSIEYVTVSDSVIQEIVTRDTVVEQPSQKVRKTESDDVYIDLSNSQVFESSELYATKMCKSVMKGDKCSFGAKCSFAHSINQLRRKECLYPNCYNVKPLGNGVYINGGNKMCEFWHKDETQFSYSKRLRIPEVAMTSPVVPKEPIKPSILMTCESALLDSTVYNKLRCPTQVSESDKAGDTVLCEKVSDEALVCNFPASGSHEYIKGCDCTSCDGNLKDRCD